MANDTATIIEEVPDGYEYIGEVMTNNDHSISMQQAILLTTGEYWGRYHGWDFCGDIWHDGDSFKCCIYVYHEPIEMIIASTPNEIMELVCEKYGSD